MSGFFQKNANSRWNQLLGGEAEEEDSILGAVSSCALTRVGEWWRAGGTARKHLVDI